MTNFTGNGDKKRAGVQRMLALSHYLNHQKDGVSLPKAEVREAVVAIRYLPMGIVITADMVELRPVVLDASTADVFTDMASVVGLRTRTSIGEGEPVRISAAIVDAPATVSPASVASPASAPTPQAPPSPAPSLPALQPGKRVMTVRVDRVLTINGLPGPGSFVDVVGVFGAWNTTPGSKQQRNVAATVLQDVEVLALEHSPQPEASTVALLVDPEEAQILAAAAESGTLRLAARPPGDHHDVPLRPITMAEFWDMTCHGYQDVKECR